ncbi:concanavalin A-like lectin/glucanase domain-containing protein [Mycena haematopus]|nr:concanavalin A-like lectin/glucanase domain-containing protein [Mycena haematopus]
MFQFSSFLTLCLVAILVAAGPCDIYASGGTPASPPTAPPGRYTYSAYSGSLYQIKRGSDGAANSIGPLSVGGVANAAAQESFRTTCLIITTFDQFGRCAIEATAARGAV